MFIVGLCRQTWELLSQHVVRRHIASVAVPWLPVDPERNHSTGYPRRNLIIGFADGHLRALNRYTIAIDAGFFPGFLMTPSVVGSNEDDVMHMHCS